MFTNPRHHRKSTGISLVEIMVGLVIGMLAVLVIYQVFADSEARKRTTTSTNDAQFNGMVSLLSIDRDVRQAGYGYASGSAATTIMGCSVRAYNQDATPTAINFRLVPVLITDGGPGLSDKITVTYSTSAKLSVPVPMWQPAPGAANYQMINNADKFGFEVGDFTLAFEDGKDCSLAVITGISGGGSDVMNHTPGQSNYDKPGGLGVDYSASAQLFNLGNPTIVQYFVGDAPDYNLSISDLKLGAPGNAANTLAVADNIVNLQAQYGVDNHGDGVIDNWQEPDGPIWGESTTTPSMANLLSIKAIRVAIVARSMRLENPTGAGGTCDFNVTAPVVWKDDPATVVDLSAIPDWKCYRYKVFQTIIPLRNMLWS
jgi:type IV pilus assembly protein PilW